jgi:DNA polymerase-3 subunit epsilon
MKSVINNKIYLSLETTGLDSNNFKIIEIAALKIDAYNNKSLFNKLINPQKKLEQEVSKLTLISDDDLSEQKNFDQIKNDLLSFLGNSRIVVHNEKFITGFLDKELKNEVKNEFEDINELYLKKFPNENASFSAILNKFNLRIDTKFSSSLNEVLLLPNIYQELLKE